MSKFLIKLEVGHRFTQIAQPAGEREPPRPTHRWTIFVRGVSGAPIEKFVEKVSFQLHEDFPSPWRVINQPPFEITECGYAGFEVPIYITLRHAPKKELKIVYDLILSYVDTFESSRVETLEIKDPKNEKLRLALSQFNFEQPVQTASVSKPKKLSPPASVESDPFKNLFGDTIKLATDKEKEKKKSSDQLSPMSSSVDSDVKPVHKKLKSSKSDLIGSSVPQRSGSSQSRKQTSPGSHHHKTSESSDGVVTKVKVKKIKTEKSDSGGSCEHNSRSASSASHSSHASTHGKSDRQLSPLPPPATIKMSPVKSEKSYHHNSSSESKLHHHIKKESTKLPAGKTPPPLPNFSLNDCSNSHPSDVSYDPNVYSARSPDPFESDASSSDVGKGTSTEPTDGNQHKNQKKKSRKHRRSQSDTEENYHTLAVSSATTITVKEEKSLSPDFSPPHLLGSGKKAVADSGVESDSSSYKQHLSPNNISVGDPLRGKKSPTITPKHHKVSNGVDHLKSNGQQQHQNGNLDSPSKPPTFDKEFLQRLMVLQRKIMCLKEKSVAQKVADIVAASGRYDLSNCSLDFDLCALDKETVTKLFDCLNTV